MILFSDGKSLKNLQSDQVRKLIKKRFIDGIINFVTLTDIRKTEWIEIGKFWDNYGITHSRKNFESFMFIGYLYFINYCYKNMEIICHEELDGNADDIRMIWFTY